MFVLVAYDISANRRRNRVVKILSRYGERVNLSVFECSLRDMSTFSALQKEIAGIIHPGRDHVRYYPLCRKCQGKIQVQGQDQPEKKKTVIFI